MCFATESRCQAPVVFGEVPASSPVRYSRPARRKRSLVFFLIHLRCAEDDLDKMATPSSDDVRGSADRISPRHAFETRIWIRLQRDGEKLSLQGWSRDLSESGVGAFVAEALILSESVTLEIPLPDCDKQVIPAKVVRALGTEYGFQFTALSAEQRRQIRAALKERPAIPRHGAGR
jgi:PilZ domain